MFTYLIHIFSFTLLIFLSSSCSIFVFKLFYFIGEAFFLLTETLNFIFIIFSISITLLNSCFIENVFFVHLYSLTNHLGFYFYPSDFIKYHYDHSFVINLGFCIILFHWKLLPWYCYFDGWWYWVLVNSSVLFHWY